MPPRTVLVKIRISPNKIVLIINLETTNKCVKLEISTICNKSFWIENDTSPQYGLHPFSSFPLMCAPPKLQMLACAMGAAPKAWKRRFAPCTSYEFHGGSFSSTTNLFLTDFLGAACVVEVWVLCSWFDWWPGTLWRKLGGGGKPGKRAKSGSSLK